MEEYGDYNLQGLHQLGEKFNLYELCSYKQGCVAEGSQHSPETRYKS